LVISGEVLLDPVHNPLTAGQWVTRLRIILGGTPLSARAKLDKAENRAAPKPALVPGKARVVIPYLTSKRVFTLDVDQEKHKLIDRLRERGIGQATVAKGQICAAVDVDMAEQLSSHRMWLVVTREGKPVGRCRARVLRRSEASVLCCEPPEARPDAGGRLPRGGYELARSKKSPALGSFVVGMRGRWVRGHFVR
jgi:hypothetical protein